MMFSILTNMNIYIYININILLIKYSKHIVLTSLADKQRSRPKNRVIIREELYRKPADLYIHSSIV